MKKLFIPVLLILSACSSDPDKASQSAEQKTEQQKFVNDSLTPAQKDNIKRIHIAFREVYPISLKEAVDNFKMDPDIDAEIVVWMNMVQAYEGYLKSRETEPDLNTKKEIFALILNRSSVPSEEAIKSVKPKLLNEKEVEAVMSFYHAEPVPMDTIK